MEAIRYCTLTGVDESTDVDRLIGLSKRFELVEWGVLYSASRGAESAGIGRYPRREWIEDFVQSIKEHKAQDESLEVNLALHLCGKDAMDFLKGDRALMPLMEHFGRVQINVAPAALAAFNPQKLSQHLHNRAIELDRRKFILQEGATNAAIVAPLKGTHCLEILFDSSGGRGIARSEWPVLARADTRGSRHGFAGGLGPDNIEVEYVKISEAAGQRPYWIDMESKLRNADDRFDLDACEVVLEAVTRIAFERTLRLGDHFDQPSEEEAGAVRQVASLDGFWLDWWAVAAAGYRLAVPPPNASRPMTFSRVDGEWYGKEPTQNAHDLEDVVENTDIGVFKRDGQWIGAGVHREMSGETRQLAMLRTLVADAFGVTVPFNPCRHPKIQASWLGEAFVTTPQAAPVTRAAP